MRTRRNAGVTKTIVRTIEVLVKKNNTIDNRERKRDDSLQSIQAKI